MALFSGGIFALPSRSRLLGDRAVGDRRFRKRLVTGLSVISFLAVYICVCGIYAYIQSDTIDQFARAYDPYLDIPRFEIQQELWLRTVFMSSDCFSHIAQYCEVITVGMSELSIESSTNMRASVVAIPFAFLAFISGLTTAVLSWMWTRYRHASYNQKSDKTDQTV